MNEKHFLEQDLRLRGRHKAGYMLQFLPVIQQCEHSGNVAWLSAQSGDDFFCGRRPNPPGKPSPPPVKLSLPRNQVAHKTREKFGNIREQNGVGRWWNETKRRPRRIPPGIIQSGSRSVPPIDSRPHRVEIEAKPPRKRIGKVPHNESGRWRYGGWLKISGAQ